jgi:hypothetical protein
MHDIADFGATTIGGQQLMITGQEGMRHSKRGGFQHSIGPAALQHGNFFGIDGERQFHDLLVF